MRIVQLAPGARFVLEKVIGSTLPEALLVGIVPVHVPRPPPTKVCAALFCRLVGRSSVKRMSVRPSAFGLVIVKVTVAVPPVGIEVGENDLVTVGGAYTMRLPVAAAPGFTAVCVLDTVPVVFGCPAAGLMAFEVTLTVMVQLAPAARLGTLRFNAVAPTVSAGVLVVPAHVPPIAVPATDMFTSVSVNARLVSVPEAFGLVSVKVIAAVPPTSIEPGTKFFASAGGESTVRLAVLDAAPVAVSSVATPLAVFAQVPETLEVTVTVTVQLAPAASEGTARFKLVAPTVSAGVLVVPAQVPPIAAPDTDMLPRASVKRRLVRGIVLPLASVKVTTLVPPWAMGLVPKALAMVGGFATASTAVFEPVPAAPVCVVATPEAVLL